MTNLTTATKEMKPNGTDTLVSAKGDGGTDTQGADPVSLPKRTDTIANKIYTLREIAVMLDESIYKNISRKGEL
jgi:hypothetical protein